MLPSESYYLSSNGKTIAPQLYHDFTEIWWGKFTTILKNILIFPGAELESDYSERIAKACKKNMRSLSLGLVKEP